MNEIKQVSTGKVELLTVKVPEKSVWFETRPGQGIAPPVLVYNFGPNKFLSDVVHLPEGNWQLVGISGQLTEEQSADIITSSEWPMTVKGITYWPDFNCIDEDMVETAVESFNTLLESMECYSENPYGLDVCNHNTQCYDSCQGSCWTKADIDPEKWEEAEKQTGTWLILKKNK